jgi:hypothetical protein
MDYLLGDNTKIYGSYEQAFSSGFAQGNGAHLYWTPGNAIPFPGGGEVENNYGKVMAGHIVHSFNATTTNDFLAAWAFGSYPFTTPNPSAAFRTTNGYPASYGKVFNTPSANIPAYNSNGNIPDFSQASIFENPVGHYEVKKEAPQFGDTLTKVWGTHTIKIGGFTQTTDNVQSSFGYDEDGIMNFNAQARTLTSLASQPLAQRSLDKSSARHTMESRSSSAALSTAMASRPMHPSAMWHNSRRLLLLTTHGRRRGA